MSKISITFSADHAWELRKVINDYLSSTAGGAPTSVGTSDTAPANTVSDDDDNAVPSADAPAFDKAGIPWDKRIHSSSKATNEDGTWRKRRNLSDVTYAAVMAELTQTTAGTAPSTPPTPPASPGPAGDVGGSAPTIPAAPAVPAPPPANAPAIPTAPAAPAPAVPTPPAAPVPVPAAPAVETVTPPPPAAQGGMLFKDFMPKVSDAIKAGRFSNDDLSRWLADWGLANVGQLTTDPAKTEQFYNWLRSAQPPLVD